MGAIAVFDPLSGFVLRMLLLAQEDSHGCCFWLRGTATDVAFASRVQLRLLLSVRGGSCGCCSWFKGTVAVVVCFLCFVGCNCLRSGFCGRMSGKSTQYLLLATLMLRVVRRRENSLILTDFEAICCLVWLAQGFG